MKSQNNFLDISIIDYTAFSSAGLFDLFLVTGCRFNACKIERNPRFQSCDENKGDKIKPINTSVAIMKNWSICCAKQLYVSI